MGQSKVLVLFAVSLLSTATVIWVAPGKDYFGYLLPFLMCGATAVAWGMALLASRLSRSDVTNVERRVRRMFFTSLPPR